MICTQSITDCLLSIVMMTHFSFEICFKKDIFISIYLNYDVFNLITNCTTRLNENLGDSLINVSWHGLNAKLCLSFVEWTLRQKILAVVINRKIKIFSTLFKNSYNCCWIQGNCLNPLQWLTMSGFKNLYFFRGVGGFFSILNCKNVL